MHSIETLRSKSNSCLHVLRVYRSMCAKYRLTREANKNKNKANDINSSPIQHILNFYITKRWLPIVSLILKLIRHHVSYFEFRSRFDRKNCMLQQIDSWFIRERRKKNSRHANQHNKNCIGRLALCWIPCLKMCSLKMKHSSGCCITFRLWSVHAQKVAKILVCRHISNSISGLYF